MNLINKLYDRVVCICLKERQDKYEYMKKQFDKHGIEVEWYRPVFPGYGKKLIEPYADKYNDYQKNYVLFNKHFAEFGPLQSHYTVIKTAILDGVKKLFVFEDDCAFVRDWDDLLPKYMNTIPEDANGVLFYSFMANFEPQNIRVRPRWTKGFASWSFVAYGIDQKTMKGYIDLQDNTPMIADRASWTLMTYHDYKFYVASPPLVVPSKILTSDVRGENKNYEKTRTIFLMGVDENNYI